MALAQRTKAQPDAHKGWEPRAAGARLLIMMTHTMDNAPRVRRQASSLYGIGCEVIALGTKATGDEADNEQLADLEIRRFDLPDVRVVRLLKGLRRSTARADVAAATSGQSVASEKWDFRSDMRALVHHAACFFGFLWQGWRAKADVYHPHDPPVLPAALVLARIRRKRLVYESHEYWAAKQPDRPLTRRWVRFVEQLGCRSADLVLVVNDTIADRMAEDYKITRPTVVLNASIAAPVDFIGHHAHDRPLEVLYHGILVPGRGIEIAIDAVALTSSAVELVIRGPVRCDRPSRHEPGRPAFPTGAAWRTVLRWKSWFRSRHSHRSVFCPSRPVSGTTWRFRTNCSSTSPPALWLFPAICRSYVA